MIKCDVLIIGGGAAALACAATLMRLNKNTEVIVAEASSRLGKKIAATGNGQGNISNVHRDELHYHGSLSEFAFRLLNDSRYDPLTLFDFLTACDEAGRIYPAGRQASAVSDSLIRSISGCKAMTDARVESITPDLKARLAGGEVISAKKILFAAGGKAQKQFGTDGSAFKMLTSLGHTVTPLYPSLVQLKCKGGFKPLRGIRADCVVSVFKGDTRLTTSRGDVIFTDYGLSGNAVFYASAYCADKEGISLSLEFLPDIPVDKISNMISERMRAGYAPAETLGGTLHNTFGREIVKRCHGSSADVIARYVKNFPAEVEGTLGWDYAQVTKGGIPAAEVDETLQSKLVKGLYFAGEALDVDGDCGGYNLHFAFASGMLAAHGISAGLKK